MCSGGQSKYNFDGLSVSVDELKRLAAPTQSWQRAELTPQLQRALDKIESAPAEVRVPLGAGGTSMRDMLAERYFFLKYLEHADGEC